MVLYESRREGDERASVPRGPVAAAVDACHKLWAEIESDEAEHGLSLTREPDPGFVWPMYRWARGETLARVLASGPDRRRHARRRLRPLGPPGARPAGPDRRLPAGATGAGHGPAGDGRLHRGVLPYTSA